MSVLISTPRFVKPRLGVRINHAHPLAPDGYWLCNEGGGTRLNNLVIPSQALSDASAGWSSRGYRSGASTYATTSAGPDLANTPFTIVLRVCEVDGTNNASVLGVGSVTDTDKAIHVRLYNDFTTVLFGMWSDDIFGTNISFSNGKPVDFAFTLTADKTQTVWANGKYNNSRTASSYFIGNTTWFFGTMANLAEFQPSTFLSVSAYKRALSAGEINYLYYQPYCFLEPLPRRWLTVVPPGADLTLQAYN